MGDDKQITQCLQELVYHMESVFNSDWEHTKSCMSGEISSCFIDNDGTFLRPGVGDLSNNWASRGNLLHVYEKAVMLLAMREVADGRVDKNSGYVPVFLALPSEES